MKNWRFRNLPDLSNNTRVCTVAAIFHYVNKCTWAFSQWRALNMTVEEQLVVIKTHPDFKY